LGSARQVAAIADSKKAAVRRSAEIGLAWDASSGARRKALYLITITSGCGYQFNLSRSACAVIHQDRRPGSELAFHRFLFNDYLGAANAARSE
jgi:hypothetical protein